MDSSSARPQVLVAVLAISALLAMPVALAEPGAIQQYTTRGVIECLKCHGEDAKTAVVGVLNTPHSMAADPDSPFGDGNHNCEGCHGPSSEHIGKYDDESLRPPPSITFGPPGKGYSPAEAQNRVCIDCHEKQGHITAWQGSAHDMGGVTCASCHSSHVQQDPVLQRSSQAEACNRCHTAQRLEGRKVSHHAMEEGLVVCGDCHSPHGSTADALLKEATVNETCYGCHAEKRGPYLWEHEPVQESCMNCHFPHGSSNQRLLNARPPFLCQQCHSSGHAQIRYDGRDLPGNPLGANPGEMQKIFAKGCLNCHSQVHGSNHPSGVRRHR